MSTRHPDLERALERLVDGGVAGRWQVVIDEGAVSIRYRGVLDGFVIANSIAEEIEDALSSLDDLAEEERE